MIFSSLSQLPGFKRQEQRLNFNPGQVFAVDVALITGKERSANRDNGDNSDNRNNSHNSNNRPSVNHWLRKVMETGGREEGVMEPESSLEGFGIWRATQAEECAEQC